MRGLLLLLANTAFADVAVPESDGSAMPMLMMTEKGGDRVVIYYDGRVLFELGPNRIMEAHTSLDGWSRAGLHKQHFLLHPKRAPQIVSWDEKGENMTIDEVEGPPLSTLLGKLRALRKLPAHEWKPPGWGVVMDRKELPADWPAEWRPFREWPIENYWYYKAYAKGVSEETLRDYQRRHPGFSYHHVWPREHLWRYVPFLR